MGASSDADSAVIEKHVRRDIEVTRRGAFADSTRHIVDRPVARTELAAERSPVVAVSLAERNAAEMGADSDQHQPLGAPDPCAVGLRVDEIRIEVVGACLLDHGLHAMNDEHRSARAI